MEKLFDILCKSSLFDGIGKEDLPTLLSCLDAKFKSYDKNHTIFSEKDATKHIGVILRGSAHMIKRDYFGNRSIIAEIGCGEIFGEDFAFAKPESISVNIIASKSSEVMLIDCDRIIHPYKEPYPFHNQLILNLLKSLAGKNIMFHQKTEITSQRSTREKLLTYLSQQAKKKGSKSFTIPFDRQELADFLEVDRSGLSSEIGKLKKEGVIDFRKSHFKLL